MAFPTLQELLESGLSDEDVSDAIEGLIQEIRSSSFQHWYSAREFAENIQKGQPYFNGSSLPSAPLRHSPSQFLQCHRKIYYRQHNAPKETSEPSGIFWFGENFENELIVPYFQAVANEKIYVQDSIWVDFTIKSRTGTLHIKGETDPVFVDADGTPFLLTEIKTKESVEQLDSPNENHLAQAHVYMYGLTQKYNRRFTDVLIVYADRSTFELKIFHREFDPMFWRSRVLDWAAEQSEFLIEHELPPADPEHRWECEFCAYQHRCGYADTRFQDISRKGLLPLFDGYSKKQVVNYLIAHQDEEAKLTPTLAYYYPGLVDRYGVYPWRCPKCGSEYTWDTFDWDMDLSNPPHCQTCTFGSGMPIELAGPEPAHQVETEHPTRGATQ